MSKLLNPYRPGAGHYPPFLAGRDNEVKRCNTLFLQQTILKNIIITGLRGVGKTVLLTKLKPVAIEMGWMWCGTDMSESASISEEAIATRLLTDLSVPLSTISIGTKSIIKFGFTVQRDVQEIKIRYNELHNLYLSAPGLISDKLKYVLESVWEVLKDKENFKGIIFAYDEVQTMQDHAKKEQFPLSLILDVFQSLQSKNIPFMLVFTGLPTLFPKLVATRTYSERMFESIFLEKLNEKDSKQAIEKPIEDQKSKLKFSKESIEAIVQTSGGYPYFIQYMCREVFDICIQKIETSETPEVPVAEIVQKLDSDFYAGRWENLSDRQRELLQIVAGLENCHKEFSIQDVLISSEKSVLKTFSSSQITQMFSKLSDKGILYRNRHGKYSFAVPLFDGFIKRQ